MMMSVARGLTRWTALPTQGGEQAGDELGQLGGDQGEVGIQTGGGIRW